jgi:phage FluMu protein Com
MRLVEMQLCEQRNVILKAETIYWFVVDPECPQCRELDNVYKEKTHAYEENNRRHATGN